MRMRMFRALALLCLLSFSLPRIPNSWAGGVGVSSPPEASIGDSAATSAAAMNETPFHLYKPRADRSRRANRDYDFLWSDTYRSRFRTPLDSLSGAEQINDLQRLAENAAEVWANPLGLAMTNIELVYNFLAAQASYRDSVYDRSPDASVGFRVAQPSYSDDERKHIDAYFYAPSFVGQGQWSSYHGDGGSDAEDGWTSNYGSYPSGYLSSAEDSLTGNAGSAKSGNSVQVPGPLPWQVGGDPMSGWARARGTAHGQLMHEGLHCLNADGGTSFLHMFASGAEVLTGVSTDAPRYDVDYHFSLSPTGANEGNAYPHWQSFMAWLATNWRGADTTATGWNDDLLRRWAKRPGAERSLPGLAARLRDSECPECASYPGFAGLDSLARVQRLIHDWRVANYVNNPELPGGRYGFPAQFGFRPSDALGAWQSVDGVAWDDSYSVPPVVSMSLDPTLRDRWFWDRPGSATFDSRPLKLSMFGAEYFVVNAASDLTSDPRRLMVRIQPDLLEYQRLYSTAECDTVGMPPATGRLFASLVACSQASDSLFRHPEWATSVQTVSVVLDSARGELLLEVPAFGGSVKSALIVISLEDGPQGYFSETDVAGAIRDWLQVSLNFALVAEDMSFDPVVVAGNAVGDCAPSWSPDGGSIAYSATEAGGGSRIYVAPTGGVGTPTPLRSASTGQYDPDWSPRGQVIAYSEGTLAARNIWSVDIATGTVQQLTDLAGISKEPAFSHDGTRVAYLHSVTTTVYDSPPEDSLGVGPPVRTHYQEVRLMDLGGGNDVCLFQDVREEEEGPGDLRALRWSAAGHALHFSEWDATSQKHELRVLDVTTRNVSTQSALAPRAIGVAEHPGTGQLLAEEIDGHYFMTSVDPYAWVFCGFRPDTLLRATRRVALRDTVLSRSRPIGYRSAYEYSRPRWSPDGTRVALARTSNGASDIAVIPVTSNRAPQFAASVQTDYSANACLPFELSLAATDPDGDAVTIEVFGLPDGAQLQSGHNIFWGYPVVGDYWLVARALDAAGGVGTRVIHVNIYDAGACGGSGGEDPFELPIHGGFARGVVATRRIGSGGARAVNSFLDGVAANEWVTQTARLVAPSVDAEGHVGTRLVGLRPGTFKADRARLLVVDHPESTVAVSVDGAVTVGRRTIAEHVLVAGGDDLGERYRVMNREARVFGAGSIVTVDFTERDSVEGLIVECARAAALDSAQDWGVRVEVQGTSGWEPAGRLRPRTGQDVLALSLPGTTRARPVFLSDVAVRDVAGYALAGVEAANYSVAAVPAASASTETGVADLSEVDTSVVVLRQGEGVSLGFDGPAPVEGRRRTHFLELRASFTPEDASAPMAARGTESALPLVFALHANRPNPFGGSTAVRFDVPRAAQVRIEIFDAQGRRVRTLADRTFAPGSHGVQWDGADGSGRRVSPGVYLYRMTSDRFREQRRMVLLGK